VNILNNEKANKYFILFLAIMIFLLTVLLYREKKQNNNLKEQINGINFFIKNNDIIKKQYEEIIKYYNKSNWENVIKKRNEYLEFFQKYNFIEFINPNLYLYSSNAYYKLWKKSKDINFLENAKRDIDLYNDNNNGRALFIKGLIYLEIYYIEKDIRKKIDGLENSVKYFSKAYKILKKDETDVSEKEINNALYHLILAKLRLAEAYLNTKDIYSTEKICKELTEFINSKELKNGNVNYLFQIFKNICK